MVSRTGMGTYPPPPALSSAAFLDSCPVKPAVASTGFVRKAIALTATAAMARGGTCDDDRVAFPVECLVVPRAEGLQGGCGEVIACKWAMLPRDLSCRGISRCTSVALSLVRVRQVLSAIGRFTGTSQELHTGVPLWVKKMAATLIKWIAIRSLRKRKGRPISNYS